METKKIVAIIPLALLVLSLVMGSSLLFRLFIVSAAALLLSYVWTLLAARGIRIQPAELPENSHVGAHFDQELVVYNDSRLPKYLVNLREETDLPGHHNLMALNLAPKASVTWRSRVDCRRRGRYRLGSIVATAGDPFGLFRQSSRLGEPRELLVYPATLELPFFEASAPSNLGDGSSMWLVGGRGPNASTVREFAWGDSPTHIHWPSTARASKLMVKVFESDRSPSTAGNIHIVLDMQREVHAGQGDESTGEYAVTIAASLAKKYVEGGKAVGLIASTDPPRVLAPERGEGHLHRVMETLALAGADGKASLDRIIANEMKQINSDAAVIIITPAVTPRLFDVIRQLKSRGDLVAVVWLEAASFGGVSSLPAGAHALNQIGIRTYLVRKGDDLARVLNQHTPVPVRYA